MGIDKVGAVSCPTCASNGWTFNCQDPLHGATVTDFSYKADMVPKYINMDPTLQERMKLLPDFEVNLSGTLYTGEETMWGEQSQEANEALAALRAKLSGDEGYNEDGIHMSDHTRPDPNATMQKWADVAMWEAPPDPDPQSGPRVTLLNMTSKPVQTMAAAAALYRGEIVRDVNAISVQDGLRWLRQTQLSRASQSQLEFVDLHFLIENVTRAFTHQLVRQRVGATYVQESLRFAVKGSAAFEIALPPFFDDLADDHPLRVIWNRAVASNSWAYNAMVDGGVPAEDARGILPTNITTRIHYKTTLRGLVDHAGLRLCSQAQHEWKEVWDRFIMAILAYGPPEDDWQQKAIASLFRPICYSTGKCEFMGASDRFCPIRERVQAHHAKGEGTALWVDIEPLEAMRYGAARVSPDVAGA